MKKAFALLASMATYLVIGQNFYSPSVSSQPYSELTNGVKQSEVPGNPGLYVLSLQKPIMLFDEPTDVNLTIGAGGFIVSQSSTHSFAVDPFLADLEEGPTNSGIFVEHDSSSTPPRLSVEWRNMIPTGHASTEFVNFTAHLYSDQSVEFHYGPSQITGNTAFDGKTGPDVFLILFLSGFTNVQEYHKMIGSPASPAFGTAPTANTLTSVPASGTVYRYEPYNISLKDIIPERLKIYPNPVSDRLKIEIPGNQSIQAISLNGREITTIQVRQGEADVSRLRPGYYFLKVGGEKEENPTYLKILKE